MNPRVRDILIFGVCVLLLLAYFAAKADWENILRPESDVPVYLNGKIAARPKSLPSTQMVSIPQEVYQSMEYDTKLAKYLKGNQKYVLVVVFGGKPHPVKIKKQLKFLFTEKGYQTYYRKRVFNLGNRWWASCRRNEICPELWIYKTCSQKVCLINPATKRAVIDSSADINQLEALLEKYKEW